MLLKIFRLPHSLLVKLQVRWSSLLELAVARLDVGIHGFRTWGYFQGFRVWVAEVALQGDGSCLWQLACAYSQRGYLAQ